MKSMIGLFAALLLFTIPASAQKGHPEWRRPYSIARSAPSHAAAPAPARQAAPAQPEAKPNYSEKAGHPKRSSRRRERQQMGRP